MTTDKEHLQWMLNRLAEVHGENRNVDYMVRMQKIIDNTETELNLRIVSESLKVGDDIIVCDDLITVVLRIEGDKIYFYDECKKEMWDIKEVIKPYSR